MNQNKEILEVISLGERKGVYKEINYYKLKKSDGVFIRLPFYGSLKKGDLIYCPIL